MASISAALGTALRQGQEVVSHEIIYGCTYSLITNWLPRFGVKARFANFLKPQSLARRSRLPPVCFTRNTDQSHHGTD